MNPILFESPRLKFREWEVSDASWLKDLNDDPKVIEYAGDRTFLTIEEVEGFIDNYDQYQNHGFGRWAVFLKENEVPIGWCGLRYNEEKSIDLGFRFFRKAWNNGYATEAAIAALNYAFNELSILEIIGRTSKANIASIKVLEKAGMTFWKTGNAHGLEDVQYYKMINPFLQMIITVEISMYPLKNEYLEPIDTFIKALYKYPVKVSSTFSCTHVIGEFDEVMKAINTEIKVVFGEGQTSFVIKVLNEDLSQKVDLSGLR